MPKRGVKILKANSGSIVLETSIGVDYRLSIPTAIRSLIEPEDTVRITIQKVKEVRQ